MESIIKVIGSEQNKFADLQEQLRTAKEKVNIPFSKEEELQETLKRLQVVNAELKIGEVENSEVLEIEDEENMKEEYVNTKEYVR